ncbi:MAG TPA: hypothetical protein VFF06_36635 [Polyangia bacterium]|nr:hypothetical protein [Polyangia bacterium]
MKRFKRVALRALVGVALVVTPSSLLADASVRAPAPPSSAQAIGAAKRLWSAIRAHDPGRIGAAVGARVRMWASFAGLAHTDDFEADIERARFAEQMTTLELGGEPARDWHPLAKPPLAAAAGTVWMGATAASTTAQEGHGTRSADLAFGVRLVDGRALVVAFDATYAESHLIFSR